MKKLVAMIMVVVMLVAFGATAHGEYDYDNYKFNKFLAEFMVKIFEEMEGLEDCTIDIDYDDEVESYVIEMSVTETELEQTAEFIILINDKVTTYSVHGTLTDSNDDVIDSIYGYGLIENMF